VATIENVTLGISASARSATHSVISYRYELRPDEEDCAAQREFTVSVGLWGEDLIDDDVLATEMDRPRRSPSNGVSRWKQNSSTRTWSGMTRFF
jgi:hypothetical protein